LCGQEDRGGDFGDVMNDAESDGHC
jgi:hypothetical protein